MNYEARIESMKAKGILSEEQARRLAGSFEKREESHTTHPQRQYTLEIVGAAIVTLAMLYIFISVGSAEGANGIEEVARSLNAPPQAGISAQSGFRLLTVLLAVLVYGVLYLYAHNRFNMFRKIAEEIAILDERIRQTEAMKQELSQTLERLLKEEKEPEGVLISTSIRAEVTETFKEMEAHLSAQKEKLAQLRQKCRHKRQVFPDTLAKLVGKLPLCQ